MIIKKCPGDRLRGAEFFLLDNSSRVSAASSSSVLPIGMNP